MEEARSKILGAASWVEALSKRRIGPASRSVMIQAHPGSSRVTVTSSSVRIYSSIVPRDPVSSTLISLLRGHTLVHSDQGHVCALVCASLVKKALSPESHLGRMPIHEARAALQTASSWIRDYAAPSERSCHLPCACHVPIPGVEGATARTALMAVVRGVVAPKRVAGLSKEEIEHVCSLLVSSFLDAHLPATIGGPLQPPRIISVCGGKTTASRAVLGLVLRLRMHARRRMTVVRRGAEGGAVRLMLVSGDVGGADSLGVLEEDWAWASRGLVDLVVCQKGVSGRARRLLEASGVVCLERVPQHDVHTLEAMSSARILREAPRGDAIPSGNVGTLGGVHYFTLVNEQFVHLEPCLAVDEKEGACRGRPERGAEGARGQVGWSGARTLMLCQRERVGIEELEEVVRSAWRVISTMMRGGLGAVAGAGCFEVHLTSYMRERARSERASPDCEKQRRRILAGLEVVADCILEIPASIDPLDAVASSQVIDALREANSASISCQSLNLALLDEEKNRVGADTECMFGWDVGKRRCVPVWGTGSENSAVLDSAEAKICSLQAAIAAAETMMQIDHVVP